MNIEIWENDHFCTPEIYLCVKGSSSKFMQYHQYSVWTQFGQDLHAIAFELSS